MTIDEFNKTGWCCGMKAKYKGEIYPIASCDFEEKLVALPGVTLGTDEPNWIRCENIEIIDDGRPAS